MHGLQLAQTLKEADPGIEITWVARSRFVPLARACSAVDDVIPFYRTGGVSAFLELRSHLRKRQFDVVLDLQGLARSGLMTFFSNAPRKVGRTDAREGATLFYKELVPLPKAADVTHPVDILLEFCRVFGFETRLKGFPRFAMPESDRDAWARDHSGTNVVLCPEGRSPDREWGGFASLATALLERQSSARVCVLVKRTLEWMEELDRFHGDRVSICVTGDPLRWARCLQDSDLLVANDSDATHMAAAMGTPTVALFGPTDGNRLGPYPLSERRNCAINAPRGDLARLTLERVLEEVELRMRCERP